MTRAQPIRTLVLTQGPDSGEQCESHARDALAAGADAVWFDLEDLCHHTRLDEARSRFGRVIEALGSEGHLVLVRIHASDNVAEVRKDLDAIVGRGLYGVLIPKCEVGSVSTIATMLDQAERERGLEVGHTQIVPCIESATSILHSYEIAGESPRIAHMGWCTSKDGDPARSIGFRWTLEGQETLYLRSRVLLAARAAGVRYPIGGGFPVYPDADRSQERIDALRQFATRERNLGHVGMACPPDPESIAIVNEVFTPSSEEIAAWQQLVADEAEADRNGRVRMPGRAKHAAAQLKHVARLEERARRT